MKPEQSLSVMCAVALAGVSAGSASADQAEDRFEIVRLAVGAGENALLIGDMNGDGFADLAVAEQARGEIAILLGDGALGFAKPISFPAGDEPTWLASADLDADGDADLAVANHEAPYVTLLAGDGAGGFAPAAGSPVPIATRPHSHVVAAADLSGDGRVDLIVDSRDQDAVAVLEGRPEGGFASPGRLIDVGGPPYLGFAVGDVDGDGRPDLAAPVTEGVSIMLNRSSDAVALVRGQTIATADPFAVAFADLDGDGALELVVASERAEPGVTVFDRSDDGQFTPGEAFPMAAGGKSVAVGDVDGDGFDDAIVASWGSDLLVLFGGADDASVARPALGAVESPWGVAAGDLDGDGRDELVVADGAGDGVNLYINTQD